MPLPMLPVIDGDIATPTTPRRWVGVVLSSLCFVHCVGAAALVPLLPAAFSFLTDSPEIEWGLFTASALMAARLWWTRGTPARRRQGYLLVWLLAFAGGLTGLVREEESLLQLSLAALAGVQLHALAWGWRSSR